MIVTAYLIFIVLTECLDLQESIEGVEGGGPVHAGIGRAPP
jgi:hypothetical protein